MDVLLYDQTALSPLAGIWFIVLLNTPYDNILRHLLHAELTILCHMYRYKNKLKHPPIYKNGCLSTAINNELP